MPDAQLPVLHPGDVVISLRGRDRGRVALVWGVLSDQRVAIVDGEVHPIRRPKRKNRRHLKKLGHDPQLAHRLAEGRIADGDIQKALAPYAQAMSGEGDGQVQRTGR
jgi:large subunit ribosomal protein L14e